MKHIAQSLTFRQPHTNPFRFVVYCIEPRNDKWVCHIQYPAGYEHGHYGTLKEALAEFARRVAKATTDTIGCGGVITEHFKMPCKTQMRVVNRGETRRINCFAAERDLIAWIGRMWRHDYYHGNRKARPALVDLRREAASRYL